MLGRIEENVLTAEKNRAYNLGKIDAYNDCIGRLGAVLVILKGVKNAEAEEQRAKAAEGLGRCEHD